MDSRELLWLVLANSKLSSFILLSYKCVYYNYTREICSSIWNECNVFFSLMTSWNWWSCQHIFPLVYIDKIQEQEYYVFNVSSCFYLGCPWYLGNYTSHYIFWSMNFCGNLSLLRESKSSSKALVEFVRLVLSSSFAKLQSNLESKRKMRNQWNTDYWPPAEEAIWTFSGKRKASIDTTTYVEIFNK